LLAKQLTCFFEVTCDGVWLVVSLNETPLSELWLLNRGVMDCCIEPGSWAVTCEENFDELLKLLLAFGWYSPPEALVPL